MTAYPVTTLKMAQDYLRLVEKPGHASADVAAFFAVRGEGDAGVEDALRGLEEDLADYEEEFAKTSFDAHARSIVHRNLTELDDEILVDPDFWRYLSSVRFRSIVSQRHPKTKKSRESGGTDGNWSNYGAFNSSVVESLFYRLYVGADATYDESNLADPYELSFVADVDLWQSHIVRVLSGDNATYARNLVRWYAGRKDFYSRIENAPYVASFPDLKNPKTDHLRDLVKRVRRLRSNVIHELFNDEEMYLMIDEQAAEALRAVSSWGRQKNSE